MRVDRFSRARLPGRLAMVFNLLALVGILGLLAIGEPAIRSAASQVVRVFGLASDSSAGVSVDSTGAIRYRSRSMKPDDLAAAIKRDLQTGGNQVVAVRVDAKADAARVAQVLRAASEAGAQTVSLSTTQEK